MPEASKLHPDAGSSTPRADETVLMLRIGEIFLKGGNRKQFLKTFLRQTKRALRGFDGVTVHPRYLRIDVHVPTVLVAQVSERLKRLFGLSSFSPATPCERDIETIRLTALKLAKRRAPGTRFKVETKRRDKTFPLPSPKVSEMVGGYIDDHTDLVVDVRNPELTITVEIDTRRAIIFGEVIKGASGLPVGTGGRAGLLLSGGIDSPVAGWLAMRRGLGLVPIYFHSFPYTGDKSKEKVIELARILSRWHGPLRLYVVHFTEVQKALRAHGWANLAVLLYRRMMMRTASLIAGRQDCKALVTGECLAQVASQTIENLGVIGEASSLPVLRPLIGYEKLEIIERAESIGTYETSILPYDDCCSLFSPKNPRTRARLSELTSAEHGIDVEAMALGLADNAEIIQI